MNPLILTVRCTLTEEMLGMVAGDPELATSYLRKQHKGEIPAELKESVGQELSVIPDKEQLEEELEKASTLFPRDEQGRPFLWNYQVRGALKDWARGMMETGWTGAKPGAPKGTAWNPWNVGKRIDSCIFVRPRKIQILIPVGLTTGVCERPLRAETMRGPRVALARSESVPEDSTFEFEVHILKPAYETAVREWIEYGAEYRGFGQWRNSGKGAFSYEIGLKSE